MILRILETPEDMQAVEALQRLIWSGGDLEVVPAHILLAAIRNGGVMIGAFVDDKLVGFVFGFPGLESSPSGLRPKHCSHMAGVDPEFRDAGLGFKLKRAQWQVVRRQGLDHITWTYDLLLSRNANLNIAKLGAVCNTYIQNYYGEMRDALNVGLPSDRFQVDWWVNSKRVNRRLSRHPSRKLDLAHYLSAEVPIINATELNERGLPAPPSPTPSGLSVTPLSLSHYLGERERDWRGESDVPLLLLEIPSDFLALKAADPDLALEWRLHTRTLFEDLFAQGYLVTDFLYLPGSQPRSFYVLSHGESTL